MTKKSAPDRRELDVPGVPETLLSQALLSRMPANLAPAPWTARCVAMIWGCRGGRDATQALPPELRSQSRGLAVIGGMVRYLDTPVGTYDEVFGIVVGADGRKPWGNVAFMAVDSEASLVGGRTNWAMPKTLAAFEGDLTGMTATGVDTRWKVSATPRRLGPSLRYKTKGSARQEFPDGSIGVSALTGSFKMRPAVIDVRVESDATLPRWLKPGRHLGSVSPEMTFTLGEPNRTQAAR
jgi:hypothetical protein